MSNGYVLAAKTDRAVAQEVAQGFGLDLVDPAAIGDQGAAVAALSNAANLGLIISYASAGDAAFVSVLRELAARAERAQLIAVQADARQAFSFLPAGWAHMTLEEARHRLAEMARRRDTAEPAPPPAPPAAAPPAPPAEPPAPAAVAPPPPPPEPPPVSPEPPPPPEPAPPVLAEAESADEEDEAPSPEQVRDYVRGEMRAFYDDKQNVGSIVASIDADGLSAFAARTLNPPADDDASPAAIVLHGLMQLALASLHARGVNVMTAGFGAVAEEAARLADAVDIDALADMMRYASEREEDPMQLVRNAAARLESETPVQRQDDAPAEQQSYDAGETALEPAPAPAPEAPADDLLTDDSFAAAPEHEEAHAPADESAPEPQAPPPAAAEPPPMTDEAPVALGRARQDEEAPPAPAAPANPPLQSMDKALPESPPLAKKSAEPPRRREPGHEAGAIQHNSYASGGAVSSSGSAPADASAFAPKKLRRGESELVQIVVHQPKDLRAVIKAARQADERTQPAPTGMRIGDVALGESVGVALEARGASCDGEIQRRTWTGAPLSFAFTAQAEEDAKQAVFIARVFVGDAEIGVVAFTRGVSGPKPKPAGVGDALRMKRHKRVFISYSSKDRETVAAIATAYEAAGVAHFFDRTSLKSGEEWSPRLRQEIDRADLFHLCWSKAAAQSEWVEKEATHALTRRQRTKGKTPAITVQMLDGPPWAPHPPELDSINFDDFVRAAIVGYARGDGEGS